jgi:hypothetical protein
MKKPRKFKVGDVVLVRGYRKTTTISYLMTTIEGGVILADAVNGLRYWNVADLILVK